MVSFLTVAVMLTGETCHALAPLPSPRSELWRRYLPSAFPVAPPDAHHRRLTVRLGWIFGLLAFSATIAGRCERVFSKLIGEAHADRTAGVEHKLLEEAERDLAKNLSPG